jgi:hypothetical protein
MNAKRYIPAALLFAGLAASALPAGADDLSPAGTFDLRKQGSGPPSFRTGPSYNNHFCYLSKVQFEETDSRDEYARCEARRGGNSWLFSAAVGGGRNSDATASCSFTCYKYERPRPPR